MLQLQTYKSRPVAISYDLMKQNIYYLWYIKNFDEQLPHNY